MPESTLSDPIDLGDGITGQFVFADPQFLDVEDESLHAWDGRQYTCCGFRLQHKGTVGNPCETTVSFANAKVHPETTPEWKLESRDPVTIAEPIICEGVYYGVPCNFKGRVVDGQWVPSEEGEN